MKEPWKGEYRLCCSDERVFAIRQQLLHCGCRRYGIVHIPKAGGTSLKLTAMSHLALSALLLPPPEPDNTLNYHVKAKDQQLFYGARVWQDAFTVAVVRNPFHLLVSWCAFAQSYCPWVVKHLKKSLSAANSSKSSDEMTAHISSTCHYLHGLPLRSIEACIVRTLDAHLNAEAVMFMNAETFNYPKWIYSYSADGVPNGGPLVSRTIHLEDADAMGSITSSSRLLQQLCDVHNTSSSGQCRAVWSHLGLDSRTDTSLESRTRAVGASKHRPALSYFTNDTCARAARQFKVSFDAFGYDSVECMTFASLRA